MALIKGTKDNFEAEVLKAEGIVVVDFGANWCGPCKSLVPILDEVVEEDPNRKIVNNQKAKCESKTYIWFFLFIIKNCKLI